MALEMLLHSAHGATRSVLRRSPASPSSARWCGLAAPGDAAPLRSRQCRGMPHRRNRCTTVMKSTEKFFVGGNWKANGTRESVKKLVNDLNSASFPKDVEVVVAPVYIHLEHVISHIDSSRFQVSAQNCWVGKAGAFTGEVAPEQLLNMGIPWVILGHSERRSLLGESNEFVGEKVANALSHGLKVMACIGETLEQRQAGQMYGVLEAQLQAIADRVSDWENVVVAYEPVWAIGTGKVATPDQAQEVHAFIRKWFSENISPGAARRVRIIYGGSVNDKNAAELASQEDLDGFLVGGASLNAPAFATICSACERVPA